VKTGTVSYIRFEAPMYVPTITGGRCKW